MRSPVLLALLLALAVDARALTQAEITARLSQKILPTSLTQSELQSFLETHVADIPQINNASDWQSYSDQLRQQILDMVIFRGEAAAWRDATTGVQWQEVVENPGPGYRIRKFILEAVPGLWVPCALYEPKVLSGKVPLIVNFNGHSPEDIAWIPKQLNCINQAKRGMLALNIGFLHYGQTATTGFDHYRINQIDLCGTSGVSTFYLVMSRALDLGLSLPNADPERVAVTGLSGGGWQTILFSPLDTRVKLCDPVAGFSSLRTRARHFADLGDSEQVPVDLGYVGDYTHLVALMAPRPTLLTYNQYDDCCFQAPYALPPLLAAAQPIFQLLGVPGNLRSHINYVPGTHNYDLDNRQAFYTMVGDFFYPGDPTYSATEIVSDSEVRSIDQMRVNLPPNNQDFHTLAMALSQNLPEHPEIPTEPIALARWHAARRAVLREIVRLPSYNVTATAVSVETTTGLQTIGWKLQMGQDWTIPAVLLTPPDATGTALVLADSGRASTVALVEWYLLGRHKSVLALDPLFVGEAAGGSSASSLSIQMSCSGARPIGVEAAQVIAAARWLRDERQMGPITLASSGFRMGAVARVAAALEPTLFTSVELQSPLQSFRQVVTGNWVPSQGSELFCFGLLKEFDMPQLVALAKPAPLDAYWDDRLDYKDLYQLAVHWNVAGATSPLPMAGDANVDGLCNSADLLMLIEAWPGRTQAETQFR